MNPFRSFRMPPSSSRNDERYEDCYTCEERFSGEEAIASYLREVERDGEAIMLCTSCLKREQTKAK